MRRPNSQSARNSRVKGGGRARKQYGSGRCKARNRDGKPCRCNPPLGKEFCYFHDPELADIRRQHQSKGGENALRVRYPRLPADTPDVDLKSAEDVRVLMSDTISRLRRGEMDRPVCATIGYLAQMVLKSKEQGEIEERLNNLEEKFGREKKA
jgi:hypothetical protein